VKGPRKLTAVPVALDPNFQDVALLAFPAPAGAPLSSLSPRISTSSPMPDAALLTDGDVTTSAAFPDTLVGDASLTINIDTADPFPARSLRLFPGAQLFAADMELQAWQNGAYQTIKAFRYDRHRHASDVAVGFMPAGPVTVALGETVSSRFRLVVSRLTAPGGLAEIEISSTAYLEDYIEKQLGIMKNDPSPSWVEYKWTTQPDVAETHRIAPTVVIDISDKRLPDGSIDWDVPEGHWVIMRYGMVPTGKTNAPTTVEGRGPEIDKMDAQAVQHHFDHFVRKIVDLVPGDAGTSLKWVVADSYEAGSQNWTDAFAAAFAQKYGYDPLPWLPALNGFIVGSADQSNRFLWDLRRLVADRISYEFVGGLRKAANDHGLKLWLENYGHWGFPGEFLQYGGQADAVGGEFWIGQPASSQLGEIEIRAAASAAHTYGKKTVSAESFTTGAKPFLWHPALLKKRGDYSFAKGVNDVVLHVFISQPYEDREPGVNAWFGTEFNRKNTWFPYARGYTDYLRRSMYLLQQGMAVVDLAYFIGEDAPVMTGTTKPAPPQGYSYDYINAEVILDRLSVEDGDLLLPDGMRYKMLVLPPLKSMRPALLRKITDLVTAGATIFGPAPDRAPGLAAYPRADTTVKELAGALWGEVDGKAVTTRKVGKGAVYHGGDLSEALGDLGLAPDLATGPGEPVLFAHRRIDGQDIYFVSNQGAEVLTFSPEFRVSGLQPELWNAVTTEIRDLVEYRETDTGIAVPLTLAPFESVFVVFRKPLMPANGDVNFPDPKILATLDQPWQVTFDPAYGGPASPVIFDELADWVDHADAAISSFSGRAVYRTTFTVDSVNDASKYLLDLGRVKVIANVKVNGVAVGSAWTAPWSVDVSKALKPGDNQLEIEVVNTWVNKVVSDLKLPESERTTWLGVNRFTADSPLDPSGLMGPVVLSAVKR